MILFSCLAAGFLPEWTLDVPEIRSPRSEVRKILFA